MILIGSRALMIQAPEVLKRNPKDFDFICTKDEFEDWLKLNASKVNVDPQNPKQVYSVAPNKVIVHGDVPCEFELLENNKSGTLFYELVKNDKGTINTKFGMVPSLNLLFALKTSHRYKKGFHFWKTLFDCQRMRAFGAKIENDHREFLRAREKETYKKKTPKLKGMTVQTFFNGDQVPYKYQHDDIHEAVKRREKPAYRYYQPPDEEVQCSKEMFFNIDHQTRLFGVIEEAEVLALERSQIPFDFNPTPKASFSMAMENMLCGIIGGWFREFAYDNAFDVLKMYSPAYVEKFKSALDLGKIRSYNQSLDNNPYK